MLRNEASADGRSQPSEHFQSLSADAPWLSVIVPTFNGAQYVRAALNSVVAQAETGVEILVSDDGSTDGTIEIVSSMAGLSRIKIIDGPRARNWVLNTNHAVAQSSGRLLTFLHQDDLWLPGRLASLRRDVERQPECVMWVGPTRLIGDAGSAGGTWRLPFGRRPQAIAPQQFLERLLVQNFIGMPAPVFTRNAFDRVGGMREDLWYTADWDLWLKLSASGDTWVSNQVTTAFRIHRESQTMRGTSRAESMRSQIEVVRAHHIGQLSGHPDYDEIDRAGRFACEINAGLAAFVGGHSCRWGDIAMGFLRLGPRGVVRFLRDARFLERSAARLRLGLGPSTPGSLESRR